MLPEDGLTASCGAVTVIARAGADRFLARCTCGCLHLVWDNASISLVESGLQKLLDHPPRDDQAVADEYEMRADPFGGLQVWAGSGGLRVAAGDRLALQTLIARGVAIVAARGVTPLAPRRTPAQMAVELTN